MTVATPFGGAGTGRAGIPACAVCRGDGCRLFEDGTAGRYWRCGTCSATFLDPARRPGRAVERAHYLLHRNDAFDGRYRRFLAKLAEPLLERLTAGSVGLDFGCGQAAALAVMLRESGHRVALYDPLFHPDTAPLAGVYDFVACSEVVEHFHRPADEFDRLAGLLRPGGWLAIMTCFQTADDRFAQWHYRRDPTHVVFYRAATFAVLARQRGWHCEIPVKDIALLRMP